MTYIPKSQSGVITQHVIRLDAPEYLHSEHGVLMFTNILVTVDRYGQLLNATTSMPHLPFKSVTGDAYRVAYIKRELANIEVVTAHTFNDMEVHPDAGKMHLLDAAQDEDGFAFLQPIGIRTPNGDYHLFV